MKKLKKLIISSAAAVLLLSHLASCSGLSSDRSDNEARIALLENRLAALQSSNSALEEKQKADRLAMESMQKELDSLIESVAAPEESPDTENSEYFGFSYSLEGENAVITAYTGDTEELIIPASILGHPVTAIADEAFKGSAIRSVSIPETVESLGWFAFASCPRLERIVIPEKVSVIGYGAFDGSPLLKVYAPADSYAARYAKSYGIPVASE